MKVKAPGKMKITARNTKTGKAVASKSFKVLQRSKSISVDKNEMNLKVGAQSTIIATKSPATSTDVVRFFSTDKTIATVGATSGKVTAKKEGKCTIKVYSKATKATSNSNKNNKVTPIKINLLDVNDIVVDTYDLSSFTSNEYLEVKCTVSDVGYISNGGIYFAREGSTATISVIYHTYKYENATEIGAIVSGPIVITATKPEKEETPEPTPETVKNVEIKPVETPSEPDKEPDRELDKEPYKEPVVEPSEVPVAPEAPVISEAPVV